MDAAMLMLLAWAFELAFGWPDWLYRRIRHPVAWLGSLISAFDVVFNRKTLPYPVRYLAGIITTLIMIAIATGAAFAISALSPQTWWGVTVDALVASSLIASRSLHAHVAAVAAPLTTGDLEASRKAVSEIVGRDPKSLDAAGIARASLESLAENASDGVIAPVFWGTLFGLPGLAAYKAINTLDSMIGHRNERYAVFGGFAARLDDLANFAPTRLTGLLIAAASMKPSSLKIMIRDARHHRSPNAGWPEAAMAGALGVRLSGPRRYGAHVSKDPWLNEEARDPSATDILIALTLYKRTMALAVCILALTVLGFAI